MAYFAKTFAGTRTRTKRTRPIEDSTRVALKVETVIEDKPGLFAIPQWNVHDATLEDRNRTNNVCEGYNNAFSVTVNHRHPVLWKVTFVPMIHTTSLLPSINVWLLNLFQHSSVIGYFIKC